MLEPETLHVCLCHSRAAKPQGETPLSDADLQREVKRLKEAEKDGTQTIIVSELLWASEPFTEYFCNL